MGVATHREAILALAATVEDDSASDIPEVPEMPEPRHEGGRMRRWRQWNDDTSRREGDRGTASSRREGGGSVDLKSNTRHRPQEGAVNYADEFKGPIAVSDLARVARSGRANGAVEDSRARAPSSPFYDMRNSRDEDTNADAGRRRQISDDYQLPNPRRKRRRRHK